MQTTLTGYLVGPIWWPHGAECFKELRVDIDCARSRFSERPTLRDLLLHVLHEEGGDFQHCAIAQGSIVMKFSRQQGRNTVTRTRVVELADLPSAKDFVHEDPDWFPDYGEE